MSGSTTYVNLISYDPLKKLGADQSFRRGQAVCNSHSLYTRASTVPQEMAAEDAVTDIA